MAQDQTGRTQGEALRHDRSRIEAGACMRVSPRVRRLIAPNASPFTFTGTCSYIVGEGELAVIDPGPESPEHLAALLEATKGERIAHIFVTHTHRDHSPGARALKDATGATILGCAAHREILDHPSGRADTSHDLAYAPDEEMADGDVFEGADFTLEAVHTPGHASNHLCFALKEENALFSGDHVMAWSTSIVAPPDGSMADYIAGLERLAARPESIYWPGHGAPVVEPQRYVRALIAHRHRREALILARLEKGAATVEQIVEEAYPHIDERLKRAAGLSTFAHLEHLVARGHAASDAGAATLTALYRAA
jgi:glyoxylase-like metal-dependent hydrolase (beta-lactamase superfamily II)